MSLNLTPLVFPILLPASFVVNGYSIPMDKGLFLFSPPQMRRRFPLFLTRAAGERSFIAHTLPPCYITVHKDTGLDSYREPQ